MNRRRCGAAGSGDVKGNTPLASFDTYILANEIYCRTEFFNGRLLQYKSAGSGSRMLPAWTFLWGAWRSEDDRQRLQELRPRSADQSVIDFW